MLQNDVGETEKVRRMKKLPTLMAVFSYFRPLTALLYPTIKLENMAGQESINSLILSTVAAVALLGSNVAEAQVRQRGQRLPSIEVNLEVLNSLRYGAPIANGPYSGGISNGYPVDPYASPAPPPQQVVPYNYPQATDQGWYGGGQSSAPPSSAPTPAPATQPPAYNPYGGYGGGSSPQDGGQPPEWAQKQMEYARRQMGLQQEQGQISTYQPNDNMGMPNELPSGNASPAKPKYPKPQPKPAPDAVSEATANMDQQLSAGGTATPAPAATPPATPPAPSAPEPNVVPPPAPLPEIAPTPAPPVIPPATPPAEIPPPPAITPPDSLVAPKLPDATSGAMDWLRDNAPSPTGNIPIPPPPAEKKEEASPPPVAPTPSTPDALPELPKMPEMPAMPELPAMPEFPSLDEKTAPPTVPPVPEPAKKEAETMPPSLPALESLPPIAAPVIEPKKEEAKAEMPPLPPTPAAPPSLPSLPSEIGNTPEAPPPAPAPEVEEPEEKGGMFPGLTRTFQKLFSEKKKPVVEEKKIEEVAPPVIPDVEPNVPSVDLTAPRPIPAMKAPVEVSEPPRLLMKDEKPIPPELPKPKVVETKKTPEKKPDKKPEKATGTRKLLEQKKEADKPVATPELPKLPALPPLGGLPPLPELGSMADLKKPETPKKAEPAKEAPKKLEMPKLELPKIEAPKLEAPKLEMPKLVAPKVIEKKPDERPMRHEVIMQALPKPDEADKKSAAKSADKKPDEPKLLKMPDLPPMPEMPALPKDMPVLKAPEIIKPEPAKKEEAKNVEKTPAPIAPPPLIAPDFEIVEKNNKPVSKGDTGEKEMALLSPAPKEVPSAPKITGNTVQVVYGRDATTIPESMKASLKNIAAKAKDEKKRVIITAYASGSKQEAKAANMISLSRALALRAYLIDAGITQDKITVKANGIENGGGTADRADVSLD